MIHISESNNIVCFSTFKNNTFIIIYQEISTGETQIVSKDNDFDFVIHELSKQQIKEVVVASTLEEIYLHRLKSQLQVVISIEDEVNFIGEFRHLYDDLTDERLLQAFSILLIYIIHIYK